MSEPDAERERSRMPENTGERGEKFRTYRRDFLSFARGEFASREDRFSYMLCYLRQDEGGTHVNAPAMPAGQQHAQSARKLGPKAVPSCQIARPKPPSDRMVRDRRNASQVARASARATAAAQISFVSRSSLSPRWHAGGCHHSRSRRGGSSLSKGGGRERAPEDDCCRRPFYNTTSPAPCGTVAGSCRPLKESGVLAAVKPCVLSLASDPSSA